VYLAYRGTVRLRPYLYRVVPDGSSSNGIFQTTYSLLDGFNSAVRDLYCRDGDFVYEHFGLHKVQQKGDVHRGLLWDELSDGVLDLPALEQPQLDVVPAARQVVRTYPSDVSGSRTDRLADVCAGHEVVKETAGRARQLLELQLAVVRPGAAMDVVRGDHCDR
jgi:hypothetical protein